MNQQAITDLDYQAALERGQAGSADFEAARLRRQLANEMLRPCMILRPSLGRDGNKWCALYGTNLMEGVAGFGDSPQQAYQDFDAEWQKCIKFEATP